LLCNIKIVLESGLYYFFYPPALVCRIIQNEIEASFMSVEAYVKSPGKEIMQGQMYVEKLQPQQVKQPYPLVLIHGAAQTATNWMMTPDGRKGWAEHFSELGYVVYMVDQPARGRSAWHPDVNGKLRMYTAPQIEQLFTSAATLGNWHKPNFTHNGLVRVDGEMRPLMLFMLRKLSRY
jgi:pimeloyl-ACP methyl ester carboxylesterase